MITAIIKTGASRRRRSAPVGTARYCSAPFGPTRPRLAPLGARAGAGRLRSRTGDSRQTDDGNVMQLTLPLMQIHREFRAHDPDLHVCFSANFVHRVETNDDEYNILFQVPQKTQI